MRLPRALYDELVCHALEEAPRECCGLVGVEPGMGMARKVYRASNASLAPHRAYEVDADDQLYLMRELRKDDLYLGAVYHSHPTSTAAPSLEDMRSPYPDVLHIIVGFGKGLEVRAWKLGNTARAVELEVC